MFQVNIYYPPTFPYWYPEQVRTIQSKGMGLVLFVQPFVDLSQISRTMSTKLNNWKQPLNNTQQMIVFNEQRFPDTTNRFRHVPDTL